MSHAAQPSPWRSALAGACAVSLSLLVAAPAVAGVTDPAYRFERIGGSLTNIAAIVQVPGVMRATVILKNGEIHRVVGDRLVDEIVGQIPGLSQMGSCPNDGVLDAAIDRVNGSQDLFVTYMRGTGANRKFTAARLPWNGRAYGTPVVLNDIPTTACDNMGGGITQASDGSIYVGVGDMGNGPGAGQDSVGTGKLWRLAPTGGAAPGNPNGSVIYGKGVCDPIRMEFDSVRGFPWFIDRSFTAAGGRQADELNFISGASSNYAWPRTAGDFSTPGFVDPIYSWMTPNDPTGLVVIPIDGNFPNANAGDIIVSTARGSVIRVKPVTFTPDATTGTATSLVAYVPPNEPPSYVDIWMPADTYAYIATPGGETFRLRHSAGMLQEPSDAQSIVPLLVRKTGLGPNGGIRLTMENETGYMKYGFYPGDLGGFPSYTHVPTVPLTPDTCTAPSGADAGCIDVTSTAGSAWATSDLSPAQVGGWPELAYFFLSGMSGRNETVLGQSSARINVPGGDQIFGCPCPAGLDTGAMMGQCVEPWTFDWGREGAGNAIGPVVMDEEWDCNVIFADFSEDWCFWCHELAPELEVFYETYRAQGFTALTIISQDGGGGNATQATVDGWVARHGTTSPVLLDQNQQAMNFYVRADACCLNDCGYCDPGDPNGACRPGQSWPRSLLFDRDGVQVDVFCGYAPAQIEAAIIREVNR